MTEAEWLTTTETHKMCGWVKTAPRRKHRLFGCECLRLVWAFCGENSPVDLSVAEAFADGIVPRSALQWVALRAREEQQELEDADASGGPYWGAWQFTELLHSDSGLEFALVELNALSDCLILEDAEWTPLCNALRDIFGNPFRPITFEPAWRSETAVGIARGIYDDRAFERLPILADALQDAGCEHPDILAHCHEPSVHVRGCWVVDLVLGKE